MQTRKYPRTMQEAFGPYTSHDIVERTESDYRISDLIILVIFFVVLFWLVAEACK